MPMDSITSYDEFITVFLKKNYPMHKTAKIRNVINQFRQTYGELFWKYLERQRSLNTVSPM